jgi:hypothetical protein
MMGSPLENLIRTNKDLDQILEVDSRSEEYNLRCTAVTVVQTPVLCKIVWLTSRCSHFFTPVKILEVGAVNGLQLESGLRSVMKRKKSSAAIVGKELFLLYMCIGKSIHSIARA